MFTAEDGAWGIIEKAMNKYEKGFGVEFPVYEYTDMTASNGFDFSVKGARKLSDFIDERIKSNKPVEVPKGYDERVY